MAVEGSVEIGPPPPGRWTPGPRHTDRSLDGDFTFRGGYVTDAELSWDPRKYDLPAGALDGVDPVVRWTLETVRTAMRDAGCPEGAGDGTGLIMGNLSYPTTGLVRFAEATWLSSVEGLAAPGISGSGGSPNPTNRFMSGLPAALAADALGLQAGSFALDAACASSLYAVKLAGDWLDAGRADVVVAGAVCCSDHLLLHEGFRALTALSRTGQSRPFDRRADGLVPAEGAAFVVLKRLEDALRAGDRVYGVVRGVGLSNDGRGQGLLVPSEEGQVRAIRAAYEQAAIDPSTISYVECHATGTRVGDATELRSMSALFGPSSGIAVGSLKYNLGHLVTVSGVAGLIKVLGAMSEGTLPPMPVEEPIEDLDRLGFRALPSPEEWSGARRVCDLRLWVRRQQRPPRARSSRVGDRRRSAGLPLLCWRHQRLPLDAGHGSREASAGQRARRHRRHRGAGWPALRQDSLRRCGARRRSRIAVRRVVRGTPPLGPPLHAR